jgi:hypothetical protein
MHILRLAVVAVVGLTGLVSAGAALPELKREFEGTMRTVQVAQRENLKALRQNYTAALAKLESQAQEKGALQDMIVLRDEKMRFEQTGEIPAAALTANLPALRQIQDDWNQQFQQAQVAQAQKIADASAKYMQNLSGLQKTLVAPSDAAELEATKIEIERLMSNNIIRDALALARPPTPAAAEPTAKPPPPKVGPPVTAAAPLTAPLEVGDYKFYPLGKEPAVKDLKDLRLDYPNTERKSAGFYYALTAKVYSDRSKIEVIKHRDFDWAAKREEGQIQSFPRITIACRNKDVPEGSKLILQYISRPTTRTTETREERVEHIALPPLVRGQTVVVDGKGIALYKFEFRGSYGYQSRSGREFYGLIVSLFDAEGKLLIQQCSPSSLAKLCGTTLPAEREQPEVGPQHRGL